MIFRTICRYTVQPCLKAVLPFKGRLFYGQIRKDVLYYILSILIYSKEAIQIQYQTLEIFRDDSLKAFVIARGISAI